MVGRSPPPTNGFLRRSGAVSSSSLRALSLIRASRFTAMSSWWIASAESGPLTPSSTAASAKAAATPAVSPICRRRPAHAKA
jgi:hypothetical protein